MQNVSTLKHIARSLVGVAVNVGKSVSCQLVPVAAIFMFNVYFVFKD